LKHGNYLSPYGFLFFEFLPFEMELLFLFLQLFEEALFLFVDLEDVFTERDF
jgi:hypothetical protein